MRRWLAFLTCSLMAVGYAFSQGTNVELAPSKWAFSYAKDYAVYGDFLHTIVREKKPGLDSTSIAQDFDNPYSGPIAFRCSLQHNGGPSQAKVVIWDLSENPLQNTSREFVIPQGKYTDVQVERPGIAGHRYRAEVYFGMGADFYVKNANIAFSGTFALPTGVIRKKQNDTVASKRNVSSEVVMYRDGAVSCNSYSSCSHKTEGLRGRVYVVFVDQKGRALWVSPLGKCTTRGSSLDITTASSGTDNFNWKIPSEVAKYIETLDIHHFDGGSRPWEDSVKATKEGVKAAGDIAKEVKDQVDRL